MRDWYSQYQYKLIKATSSTPIRVSTLNHSFKNHFVHSDELQSIVTKSLVFDLDNWHLERLLVWGWSHTWGSERLRSRMIPDCEGEEYPT